LREFKVQANVGKPQVAYREAITKRVKAEGKFVRQSGGKGQYGHCVINMWPTTDGEEFVFENKITGGDVPREYVPSIEKGIREAMRNGILAGYQLTGVHVELIDGSYHDVDSSEMAFKIAGSMAFQNGARKAGAVLLEPIMSVVIVTPEAYVGTIVGDINGRRGRIGAIEARADEQTVTVDVPLSEMFGYATNLRNISQGRAVFSMHFHKYMPLPAEATKKILEKAGVAQ